MNYALAVLTSPRSGDCLARTLASFETHVSPRPVELYAYADGNVTIPPLYDGNVPWDVLTTRRQGGFCRAVRELWRHVGQRAESSWVFWLEDDFTFNRTIDLRALANTMEWEPQVAQMALYRDPVNPDEVQAGGYIAQHPEEYTSRGGGSVRWFETRRNWTTNPALFRRRMCVEYEWPSEAECEGHFGFRVREREPDTTFGIWGAGDAWVTHTGVREGFGY